MKATVTVKFRDGSEYSSVVTVEEEVRRDEITSEEAVLNRLIRSLQRQHPQAEISWRKERR